MVRIIEAGCFKREVIRKFVVALAIISILLGMWLFGYIIGSKRQADFDAYSANFLTMYDSYLVARSLESGSYQDALRSTHVSLRAAFQSFQKSPLFGRSYILSLTFCCRQPFSFTYFVRPRS